MNTPSIVTTLLLATLLVVPYVFKLFFTEPYPAVIFPSGANTINLNEDVISFGKFRLYAETYNGQRKEVSPVAFIAPAKPRYLYAMISNDFGLNLDFKKRIRGRRGIVDFKYTPKSITGENVEESRVWLLEQFKSLGIEDAKGLVVVSTRVTRDLESGEIISEKIEYEKYYSLLEI